MEHFELVEKLRGRTGLNYEEAKTALESSGWDLLEAMVRLESAGKVPAAQPHQDAADGKRSRNGERAGKADDILRGIGAFLSRAAELGMRNRLEMRRDGKVVTSLPLLLVAVLALLAFWAVIPAAVVALCFGFRFGLTGSEAERAARGEEAGRARG